MMSPSSRPIVPHARGARLLFSAVFIGIFALAPLGARADTEGGQASVYSAYREAQNLCTGWEPEFNAPAILLVFNPSTDPVTLKLQAKSRTGLVFNRTVTVPAQEDGFITSADPGWTPGPLPANFEGTISADCEPKNARVVAVVGTEIGGVFFAFVSGISGCIISSPLFFNNKDGWSSTLVLHNHEATTASAEVRFRSLATGALVATREVRIHGRGLLQLSGADLRLPEGFEGSVGVSSCLPRKGATEISGVVSHQSDSKDAFSLEAIDAESAGSFAKFLPVVFKAADGWTSRVTLQNRQGIPPLQSKDASVKATFRSPGKGEVERQIHLRGETPREIDLSGLEDGVWSVELEGSTGSSFVAAAYHFGPNGATSANNAISANLADTRVALPLLFRKAANEGAYESMITVMMGGGVLPRVTFYDRDTGARVGPIQATGVVRTGDMATASWKLSEVEQLKDGNIYNAIIDSDSGGTFAAIAGFTNTMRNTAGVYSSFPTTGALAVRKRTLTAPIVYKNVDGMSSGIQIQNLVGRTQTVRVEFRTTGGTRISAATQTVALGDNGSATIYLPAIPELADGFVGSAQITGQDALGAVVNTVRYKVV